MQIDKLVQLINLELKKDSSISVNKICNKLQLRQSTVKTQLRNNNYSYNAEQRQYTKNTQKNNENIKEVAVTKIEPKTDDIQRYNKDIDINSLKELIDLIEPIKAIIEEYNKSKTIVEVNPIQIRPKAIKEVKQKLFKVDVNVLEKWDKFIADHKEFKVQQLISLALEEFINKYS
ncbi:hypothetical protein [Clostridium sp.]|uniref:hypothetical protein n=1 Tax=Clostridium sp. TaxID=1506 RepID=UPI003990DB32